MTDAYLEGRDAAAQAFAVSPALSPAATKAPRAPLGELLQKVPSQTPRQYAIRRRPDGTLTCSCPDFKYRQAGLGGACKHIKAVQSTP